MEAPWRSRSQAHPRGQKHPRGASACSEGALSSEQAGRYREHRVSEPSMRHSDLSDEEKLIRAAAAGDRDAAATLFERHWEHVWRAAYRVLGRRTDADDVAQEAFVAAFKNLAGFEGRSTFRTWITRIAINRALNALRDEKKRLGAWTEVSDNTSDTDVTAAELVEALSRLSIERRTVFVLRYWLGCSVSEIAALLQIPLGTVNSRLARALAEIRTDLEVPNVH